MIKPRRFNVLIAIRGVTWRRIQVEVAFGDGNIGEQGVRIPSPFMGFFGLDSSGELAAITMDYQVAQKLHACTDPHRPPDLTNDRVRDIVDLVLIQQESYPAGTDLTGIRAAAADIFAVRAAEAVALGRDPRP